MKRSSVQRVVARYLSAAPLDDYYSMPNARVGDPPKTVGWGREKINGFLEAATIFFETRKDSWAIIIPRGPLEVEGAEAYAANNPKLRRSKIIIVDSNAMDGDYNTSRWIIRHDIIGHGIAKLSQYKVEGGEESAFHEALPLAYRTTTDPEDFGPDIYAAIFFHATPKDFAERAAEISLDNGNRYPHSEAVIAERKAEYRRTYAEMREDVARWTSGFKPGVPRRVRLW